MALFRVALDFTYDVDAITGLFLFCNLMKYGIKRLILKVGSRGKGVVCQVNSKSDQGLSFGLS